MLATAPPSESRAYFSTLLLFNRHQNQKPPTRGLFVLPYPGSRGLSSLCFLCARPLPRPRRGVSALSLSSSYFVFSSLLRYILTSCFSQCTASSAPQSTSSASFVVFRISSLSPLACSFNHPRQAARCSLSASSCTSKYASPSGCVTP